MTNDRFCDCRGDDKIRYDELPFAVVVIALVVLVPALSYVWVMDRLFPPRRP